MYIFYYQYIILYILLVSILSIIYIFFLYIAENINIFFFNFYAFIFKIYMFLFLYHIYFIYFFITYYGKNLIGALRRMDFCGIHTIMIYIYIDGMFFYSKTRLKCVLCITSPNPKFHASTYNL